MKKYFGKIGALVLAGVMAMAMSVTAFAAGNGSDSLGSDNIVTIKDVLKVYNPDETSVYAPDVTFHYSITAGTGGATVTDENDVQAIVLAGNWSGTNSNGTKIAVSGEPSITESVAYTSDNTLAADDEGAANEKIITVNFEKVTFPKPGIYRYEITRTTTDTYNVLESKEYVRRYFDVYVKEENSTRTIYGYILHDISGDISKTSTTKYNNFTSEYKTSNLTVGKTLVNDATMNGHQFPFSVSFVNTKNAHIMVDPNEGVAGKATATAMNAGATTSAPTIANEGIVKYIGIPNGFTSTVYETNDVTGTTYKSEATADNTVNAKNIIWTTEGDANKSNDATTSAAEDQTKTIAFTNTLEVISPTGLFLRFTPFLVIIGAAVLLLLVSRRRGTKKAAGRI